MTEVFSAVLSSEDQLTHPAAAGRPVPGVEMRLLDDAGNDVPAGAVGEIVIRCGEPGRWFVMRGYW
jgi:acyl-coenzyme A synthetase/AMP-(fatty) acid ligase